MDGIEDYYNQTVVVFGSPEAAKLVCYEKHCKLFHVYMRTVQAFAAMSMDGARDAPGELSVKRVYLDARKVRLAAFLCLPSSIHWCLQESHVLVRSIHPVYAPHPASASVRV